jgi:large subunit ribosomal protein L9
MRVILMEDVPMLGQRGEVREVKDGYARNFLLPRKLALPATATNLQNLAQLKRQRERAQDRAREAARAAAARIGALALRVVTRASEDGRLYGSVSVQDVVAFLEQHEIAVERRRVLLEEPIKALGEYRVAIRLPGDVTAELPVSVVRA